MKSHFSKLNYGSMKKIIRIIIPFGAACLLCYCTPVKEYQKMYINDRDMEFNIKSVEKYESNMEVFREGAAGANGGKSGGGCACN